MKDWPAEIAKGALIQQRIEELDHGHIWTRRLPELAATEDEILDVETRLGQPLEPQYRAFLRYADGWNHFFQYVDLFGTRNLLGASPMDAAKIQLRAIGSADLQAAIGVARSEVIPIGASLVQSDMFLLTSRSADLPGAVIWFAGEAVERYSSFDEFFLAMLDYNRLEIKRLEARSQA